MMRRPLKETLVLFQYLLFFLLFPLPLSLPLSLQQLPVITSNTIVRCRSCRTYINPFVTFLDQRRWKCNLCYRVNDGTSAASFIVPGGKKPSPLLTFLLFRSVPDEFMYNPVTRSYGDPQKRPEVQNATVEFIASSDYMVSRLGRLSMACCEW